MREALSAHARQRASERRHRQKSPMTYIHLSYVVPVAKRDALSTPPQARPSTLCFPHHHKSTHMEAGHEISHAASNAHGVRHSCTRHRGDGTTLYSPISPSWAEQRARTTVFGSGPPRVRVRPCHRPRENRPLTRRGGTCRRSARASARPASAGRSPLRAQACEKRTTRVSVPPRTRAPRTRGASHVRLAPNSRLLGERKLHIGHPPGEKHGRRAGRRSAEAPDDSAPRLDAGDRAC
eukprot:2895307-Prymnesium_polylepis.1